MIRLLKFFCWSILAVVCGLLLGLSGAYLYLSPGLPSVEALKSVQLQIPLRVYSSDGKLIAEFGEMRRSPIKFSDIPPHFIQALLSAEDDNFENHYGVDPSSLVRAASQLLRSGHIQTGGSTITMQVAKNYFLSSERSFSRKTNEILLALQIERQLSKDEILELYVNKIYLGNRAYGIEAAAQVYYGKSIRDCSLAQMAMIAGLPKAPSRFNPLANPARAKERRDWILGRMYKLGKVDEASYQAALAEPINASYHVPTPELNAPYIAEMARAEMVGRYGSEAYTEGFRVTTTVPSQLQEHANKAVLDGLTTYDQRHGYRGPESRLAGKTHDAWLTELQRQRPFNTLEPVIVTRVEKTGLTVLTREDKTELVPWDTMKWARPFINTNSQGRAPSQPADVAQAGDLVRVQRQPDGSLKFSQVPTAQSALVSLDPHDGAIKALVGGFAFEQSNYNRAMQAKRQPGSSFKPFIYSAALDNGYTPASLVNDAPIVFVDEAVDKVWRPKNDTNTFLGPIRLREALYKSRNLVSIRVLQSLGVQHTIDYITRFGFNRQDLPQNLSLALGTATLTPMEIATGWSAFANGGFKVAPYLIQKIESRNGDVLFTAAAPTVPTAEQEASEPPAPVAPVAAGNDIQAGTTAAPAANAPVFAQRIIDGRTTYILTSMLQDVIKKGTGRRALALNRPDLAGKTGTTNDSKDAWFSGYNADYMTTVWTGFDQPETLGHKEFGGTVSLPIWMDYMGAALKDKPPHTQAEPEGIVSLRVDPVTGRAATPATPNAYFELFKSEDTPPSVNELGNGAAPGSPLPADEAAPMDLF